MTARRLDEQNRVSFVRNSVEENAVTKQVIDQIMPYFPKGNQIIGGWVNDSKQYWKANFHWEYLLAHLKKAEQMELSDKHKKCVSAIRSVLEVNKPNPISGYTKSRVMGQPKDLSPRATVIKRWAIIRQCKKDFKSVMNASNMLKGMPKKKKKTWLLAVAPVAKPGTSKHSTGYAVDIYGDNLKIQKICKDLKASLVYPEGSHVHVEFKNGVLGKSFANAGQVTAAESAQSDPHYMEDMCLMTPEELAELKLEVKRASATDVFKEEVSYMDVLSEILDDVVEAWHR